MISVEDREKIRRAYFNDKKSLRQIAKELHVARKTVCKAIAAAEPETYTRRAPRAAPILGPFKQRIDELLSENEHLPPKQRYIGPTILKELQKLGYQGSESTLRGYIGQRRQEKRRPKVYLPLEFDPGADAQADWGEAVVEIAGERITVQIFYMRLCYSRKLFMMAFPAQKQEAFTSTDSVQASKATCRRSTIFRAFRTGSATTTSRRLSRRSWKGTPGRSNWRSSPCAATTCSRATSAHQARVTRKAVSNTASASGGATSWCPSRKWPPLRNSTRCCWPNA